jgi:hypothetical protein
MVEPHGSFAATENRAGGIWFPPFDKNCRADKGTAQADMR